MYFQSTKLTGISFGNIHFSLVILFAIQAFMACLPPEIAASNPGVSIGTVDVIRTFHYIDTHADDGNVYEFSEYQYSTDAYDIMFEKDSRVPGVLAWLKDDLKSSGHVVFPDYIRYGSTVMEVTTIRMGSANPWERLLSYTFPATIKEIRYGSERLWYHAPCYFLGDCPWFHVFPGNDTENVFPREYLNEVYVAKKSAFEAFKEVASSNHHECTVQPFGWDFPTHEVDLGRGMSFEEICEENGWTERYNFIVKGRLDDADFEFLHDNNQIRKLDFSQAQFSELPSYCFDNSGLKNSYLVEIVFPPTLQRIGERCFYSCYDLRKAEGFRGKEIGRSAFSGCYRLLEFDASSADSIGKGAFSLSGISRIEIPGVRYVSDSAFEGCGNLVYADVSGAKILGMASFIESGLREVKLGNSLEEIGSSAFRKTMLTRMVLPESVGMIGVYAFAECRDLTAIQFPKKLKIIPKKCCTSCYELKSVILPDSLEEIGYERLAWEVNARGDAFFGCLKLTEIRFPETLKRIGPFAFYGSGLEEIKLPEGLTHLDFMCFGSCPVKEVAIPDSVIYIDDAFAECKNLKYAIIGKSVENVDGFRESAIESVEYAADCVPVVIGYNAFYNCVNYRNLQIPESVIRIEGNAYAYSGIEKAILKPHIIHIGYAAFDGCPDLTEIEIPYSFDPSVNIGNGSYSESYIGDKAFRRCPRLQIVRCHAAVPPVVEGDPFADDDFSLITLYVPGGSASLYASDEYWSRFINIKEDSNLGIPQLNVDGGEYSREYYDLQGRRVIHPSVGNVYIEVSDKMSRKVVFSKPTL